VTRGERIGRVSSEWFPRPGDKRFLSPGDLGQMVRNRAERCNVFIDGRAASR
jgi:hypothetical protein